LMKNPTLHALNIGTLALWLSVAGFAAVAIAVPAFTHGITAANDAEFPLATEDFSLGKTAEGTQPNDAPAEPTQETLPAPPEMPSLAEVAPLPEIPEIPDLPAPATRPAEAPGQARSTSSRTPVDKPSQSNAGTAKPGAQAGMSAAARLAAGQMPMPIFPPYARRNNQTGTVVVQFTIAANGQVVAASLYKSSNWPLLDHEALRTVRTWKFPPGEVLTYIRPISFKLN
ncbi:MAG: energy transducer TonB, partial [Gloeobacteraceae cyanobacterium ES-bin-144]|nr:energy transducer TonB [Verrucomicrobiales bacterium]